MIILIAEIQVECECFTEKIPRLVFAGCWDELNFSETCHNSNSQAYSVCK